MAAEYGNLLSNKFENVLRRGKKTFTSVASDEALYTHPPLTCHLSTNAFNAPQ